MPRKGLHCDVVDPDVFQPWCRAAGAHVCKAPTKVSTSSLEKIMTSSVAVAQSWFSTKNGAVNVLSIVEEGSFYDRVIKPLGLPFRSGESLQSLSIVSSAASALSPTFDLAVSSSSCWPVATSVSVIVQVANREHLPWQDRASLLVTASSVAQRCPAVWQRVRYCFRVERLILRRVGLLQSFGLPLPTALSVVSSALVSLRHMIGRLPLTIKPRNSQMLTEQETDSLMADVVLSFGVALSPLPAEDARVGLRRRHRHRQKLFDGLVATLLSQY